QKNAIALAKSRPPPTAPVFMEPPAGKREDHFWPQRGHGCGCRGLRLLAVCFQTGKAVPVREGRPGLFEGEPPPRGPVAPKIWINPPSKYPTTSQVPIPSACPMT